MIKKIFLPILLLVSGCSFFSNQSLNSYQNQWGYHSLVYESASHSYTYPFEIPIPKNAEISFGGPGDVATILSHMGDEKTDIGFEVIRITQKNLEEAIIYFCRQRDKNRGLKIALLQKYETYSIFLIESPCKEINSYAVRINDQYFYFSIIPKRYTATEPIVRYMLENLKITN